MPITVNMIEEKEFKIKVRGYDPVEVDEFLDEICDEMIVMQETIASLRDKVAKQDSASFAPPPPMQPAAPAIPLSPTPPPAERFPADLETAKKLLEDTQKSCDEALANAKKRANEIIQEAKDRVPDPELTDLETQRDSVRQEIETLKEELESFRNRFKSMLNDQKDLLDAEL
ncbi:MAG: DivIVA domain-containing protein [Eubacteriales bacterium]|nr:DivIVA domain-containing protein [Eubacteriales bacterium]